MLVGMVWHSRYGFRVFHADKLMLSMQIMLTYEIGHVYQSLIQSILKE